MALARPALKIHFFLQQLIPPTFAVDIITKTLVKNPIFHQRSQKLLRYNLQFYLACVLFLDIWQFLWLCQHWKSYTIYHIEQVAGFVAFLSAMILCILFNLVCQQFTSDIIFLINNVREVIKDLEKFITGHKVSLSYTEPMTLEDICVYGCSFGFFMFPLGMFGLPFVFEFDPIQIILGTCFSVKIFAGFIYFAVLGYSTLSILSGILIAAIAAEGIQIYTNTIHFQKTIIPIEKLQLEFRKSLTRYQITRILCKLGNEIFEPISETAFLTVSLLATSVTYVLVSAYHKMDTILNVSAIGVIIMCYLGFITFNFIGAAPHNNMQLYTKFWKNHINSKYGRKALKSCRITGFKMGAYGLATEQLGLHFCDVSIVNTVSLLLVSPYP